MGGLRRAVLGFDRVLGVVEAAVIAALVVAITIVTFAQVVSRYVLSDPILWSEEVARYLFVWITLVGAAAAVRTHGHFGLDLLRKPFPSGPLRTGIGLVATLVVGGFLAVLFYAGVIETRQAAMQYSAALPITLQLPFLALPVGAALGLLHLVAHWFRRGIGSHPLDDPPEEAQAT